MSVRRYHGGFDPAQAHSIDELADMARRYLPPFAWEYLAGGAEQEATLTGNRQAFAGVGLHARTLVPCAPPDTRRTLFGKRLRWPWLIGPTGYNGMLHRDADLHLARAAAARGVPLCLSTVANLSMERLAREAPGLDLWFQLYAMKDPVVQADLLARAWAAGVRTLVVTSDAPVLGNREWDRRNFARPRELRWRRKLEVLRHPRWVRQVLWPAGLPSMGNLDPYLPVGERTALGSMKFIGEQMNPLLHWEDLARLRDVWRGRLLLKGVLHEADAEQALALGLDGVVVSNHGGRQLDGAAASLDALGRIAPVVSRRMAVLLDSGIRRGSDVVKALALGADAVLLGRATLYGVAVAGEAGAGRALDLLAEELVRTLHLMGCGRVDALGSDWLI